nr:hypothetical protein Iba_chr02aCG10670 [Ipomoea batatas]
MGASPYHLPDLLLSNTKSFKESKQWADFLFNTVREYVRKFSYGEATSSGFVPNVARHCTNWNQFSCKPRKVALLEKKFGYYNCKTPPRSINKVKYKQKQQRKNGNFSILRKTRDATSNEMRGKPETQSAVPCGNDGLVAVERCPCGSPCCRNAAKGNASGREWRFEVQDSQDYRCPLFSSACS